MASGWTQRGFNNVLAATFRGVSLPTNFYVVLITGASVPSKTTTTFSGLTEIVAGNGYTSGGYSLTKNTTDFDTLTEADPTLIQIKDLVWTASGGSIPASGGGARYAVLTDDNATLNSREIWCWWDLQSDRSISDTQTLTLQNLELNGDLP